jgi:hypothetical protein
MKNILVIFSFLFLAGCSQLPIILPNSPKYPPVGNDELNEIVAMEEGQPDFSDMQSLAEKIGQRSSLSYEDLDRLQSARAKNAERKIFIARQQEILREKARAEKKDAEKLRQYRYEFKYIDSPESAMTFIARYDGTYDPDGLSKLALDRGYQRGIERQKDCISYANKVISQQKEIGNAVGLVDRSALYSAGVMLVDCKKYLARYTSEYEKIKK